MPGDKDGLIKHYVVLETRADDGFSVLRTYADYAQAHAFSLEREAENAEAGYAGRYVMVAGVAHSPAEKFE
jgi:hypothetical protein